jgi:hypothetical protein
MVAVISGCGTSPQAGPTSAPPPSATPTSTPAPEPTSTPEPEPAPTPSPTRKTGQTGQPIPAGAMLRGTDIGREFTTSDDPVLVHNDHGRLGMMLAYCGQYDYGPPYLVDRTRSAGAGQERYVKQLVERYGRGDGARYMDGLRRVLPRCRTMHIMADPKDESTLTVVGSREFGDDSLLIRHNRKAYDGKRSVEYYAVARQGDVVMSVRIHIGATEGQAREILRRLTNRLCAATPTC